MKFFADMGISPKTITFLVEEGHDAIHLHELGMDRSFDAAILEMARSEHRILLTHDLDFGDLMAASATHLPRSLFSACAICTPKKSIEISGKQSIIIRMLWHREP